MSTPSMLYKEHDAPDTIYVKENSAQIIRDQNIES